MLVLGRFLVCLGLWFCCYTSTYADSALLQKRASRVFIQDMVQHHHFSRNELVILLRKATFQPHIIELMDHPYEKKSWDTYKGLFLTEQRLQEGLQFWQDNKQALALAEKQFGVPAPIIVAILGVETLYGKNQGSYRVLDALSTLAFYYPPRSSYFTKELKEFLLLCREHHVSPLEYKGSYAGAMGKPQFMPSSYRYYARNLSGNHSPNLMQDNQAVIASVANYFHQHGWHGNDAVAEPANPIPKVPKAFAVNRRNADYEYQRFIQAGLISKNSSSHHPEKAGLIELTTTLGQSYWVAYPNFYVITRYNTNPQYALVVYLLSQQLQYQWSRLNHKHPL